jgi:inhibitor of cysteine peptidase
MSTALEINDQANGKTVVLKAGQTLVIRLPENPTTGYRWAVESCGTMRLDKDEFFPIGTGVGAGGTRQLQWRAESSGRHHISLVLRRSWEAINMAIERFSLTIVSS